METIQNTYQGWEELFGKYVQKPQKPDQITVIMDPRIVELEDTSNLSDVTNLRYVFPLAEWLRKHGQISSKEPLEVDIRLPDEDGNVERVRCFLANARNLNDIRFRFNGELLTLTDWEPGRIFPLCQVSDPEVEEETAPDYRGLRYSMDDVRNRENPCLPAADMMAKAAQRLLEYINNPKVYKGTQDQTIRAEDKNRLQADMKKKMEPYFQEMDMLSFVIWLFLLRELIESKQLYTVQEKGMRAQINEEIVTKSRMDAVSYGEAIYQLIENACVHATSRRAWFGFRMHRAGRNVPMGELVKETGNRKRLYEKYRSCFTYFKQDSKTGEERPNARPDSLFSGDNRCFFEFFVLDGAWDQVGMLEHYNSKELQKKYDELKEKRDKETLAEDDQRSLEEQARSELEAKGTLVHSIAELLRIQPDRENAERYIEDITVHYGLRLLQRIVAVNGGYLTSRTPDREKPEYYFNGNEIPVPSWEYPRTIYMTEWSALLPVSYHWIPVQDDSAREFGADNCFEQQISQRRERVCYLNCGEIVRQTNKDQRKVQSIQEVRRVLYSRLPWEDRHVLSSSILLLRTDSPQLYQLELFAKALFACIAKTTHGQEPVPIRIAVLLPATDTLHELLRLFSVFYIKGEQPDMEDVQVAFCSQNQSSGLYRVNFILAGSSLSSAFEAARLFAYHHSEDALEHLPLLDYLTNQAVRADGAGSGAKVPPLYPFDLFLPSQLPEGSGGELRIDPWKDSWFLEHIKFRLNRDIRDGGDGCMIDGIHARLGSKLHLGRFFEGELLFHDMGNILRFAYLLAYQLLYGEDILMERQHVVLLGYEKYSTTLMLQLEEWLKRSNRFSAVHTAIVYDGEEDADVMVKPCYDADERGPDGSIQIVTVMPLGTTLSTVYKTYHVARKDLRLLSSSKQELSEEQMKNFCLVLVNQDLFRKNDISAVTKRYWHTLEREQRTVTVQREVGEEEKQKVRYLLAAEAEWLAPETCHICRLSGKETRAIIDAKNSNTMLSSIFTLWEKREGRFFDLVPEVKENQKRLRDLFGTIQYSHIYDRNNHFQFYLDFSKLYYEHREEIDQVISDWTVPADAFHVVVSPLEFSNAPFLKSVLDRVFHGSARFLHIDLKGSYREEIRMKFIYIAEEFKHMRRISPHVKFCVHFVDTSIVTGGTLSRAGLLIRMLLHQVGCLDENVELFSKVFLLVNRCSYATVQSFVRDPRRDMQAYIYLAIPSYNTENDFCPACRQVIRYHLLQKRSATERLSNEFKRLKEKHTKRKVGEYDRWLDKTILDGASYFGWLRQWLYIGLPDLPGKGRRGACPQIMTYVPQRKDQPIIVSKRDGQLEFKRVVCVRDEIEGYVKRHIEEVQASRKAESSGSDAQGGISRQEILNELSGMCLRDVVRCIEEHGSAAKTKADTEEERKKQGKKFKKAAVEVVRTYLINTRNYMRLYSMQRAYEELEAFSSGLTPSECSNVLDERTRETMLRLIATGVGELAGNQGQFSQEHYQRVQFMNRFEWIVSYIKVLSREQIAKYYHCRRAIMGIMNDIMRLLYVKHASRSTVNNGQEWGKAADELKREDKNWEPLIEVIEWLCADGQGGPDLQLRAHLEYQLTTMLLHRTADLQLGFVTQSDNMTAFLRRYYELVDRCFLPWEEGQKTVVPRFVLPPYQAVILRYLKSVKAAVMTSEDDTPCLALAKVPDDIVRMTRQKRQPPLTAEQIDVWLLFARYIYLENSRMLYSGMRDLELKLSPQALKTADSRRPADGFNEQMEALSGAVDACLKGCYEKVERDVRENDILYQNILGNFCRFWHRTATQLPVQASSGDKKTQAPLNTIAYLLQYFRRVKKLFNDKGPDAPIDELPYRYEELCHIICGLTGYSMCYMAFRSKDAAPHIFTQSGYHVETMRRKKILTAARLDELLHEMDQVREAAQKRLWGSSDAEPKRESGRRFGQMLIPGVTHFQTAGGGEDFLIVTISRREEPLGSEKFYVVLQGEQTKEDWERQRRERPEERLLCLRALEKARNILFMRRRLKHILSRDYTLLHSLRFDCSYVRPICDEPGRMPCLLHISDLHIKEDLTSGENSKADRLIEKLGKDLGEEQIDLLAITGDIVDGREANAPQMEHNYQYAEELLNRMAILIWENKDGYLPHDWRRRVILTTGNHDYAAMNQFKAIVKRRALASGLPVESESGTMSKFAYYIDFLIRYLDPPIDELIANDLNEIRHYRKLNIKVLVLNCSGNAVPRRTNKMGVNQKKVETLLEQRNWKEDPEQSDVFRLCLAHYSPDYGLSYFLDDYDVLPGWEWSPEKQDICPINILINSFCACVEHEIRRQYVRPLPSGSDGGEGTCAEQKGQPGEETAGSSKGKKKDLTEEADRVRTEFLDQFKALGRALEALESGKSPADSASERTYKWLKERACRDGGASIAAKMRKNELYRQIKNFCDWLEEPGCLNREPISQLLYEVQECVTMSKHDKKCFEGLLKKVKRDLYLAGHIHAYADSSDGILVADKFFYEGNDDIRGYVIKLKRAAEDSTGRYAFRRLR